MANEDDKIIIKIDLDDSEIDKTFEDIEGKAKETGKVIDESIFSKISKGIVSIGSTINKIIDKLLMIGSAVATIVATLKLFGVDVTKQFEAVNKKISPFVKSIVAIKKSFDDLGKSSPAQFIKEFSLEIVGLLSALGLSGDAIQFVVRNLRVFAGPLLKAIINMENFKAVLGTVAGALGIVVAGFKNTIFIFKEFGKIGVGIGQVVFGNIRSLFGLTTAMASLSAGLLLFGQAFERSNNEMLRMASTVSLFAGVLLGTLSAAIGFAIIKIGQLTFALGTSLVNASKGAAASFVATDKSLLVFTKTIEAFRIVTSQAIQPFSHWNRLVGELSEAFNLSRGSLRKATGEIIRVGEALGLAGEQMGTLLLISAEYAKINGKDVFDTSVRLVSALNGQAQSVTSLGIKLNEASNSAFAFKKGIDRSFASLADTDKVQVRYNNLLKQYSKVAGIGEAITGTLADQQERYKNTVNDLNVALGRGAAVIENNNILYLAANKALELVNQEVLTAVGFLRALAGRVLQVAGFFLEWSFKIFAVVKVFKLLDVFLKSDLAASAFAKNIPFVNQSLTALISRLAGVKVSLASAGQAFSALALVAKNSLNKIVLAMFGVQAGTLTLTTAFKGLFRTLSVGFARVAVFLAPLLSALAPFLAVSALLVATFIVFRKAILELEKRTKVFSELWQVMVDVFNESTSVFDPVKDFFISIGETMKTIGTKIIGLLVTGIAFLFEQLTALAIKNPFNIFSKDTIKRITSVNRKLASLRTDLQDVAFDLRLLGETALASSRKIASSFDKINIETFRQLKDALQDVGKTDIQLLQDELTERNRVLRAALMQGFTTQQEFDALMLKAQEDFSIKRKAILDRNLTAAQKAARSFRKMVQNTVQNGLVKVISAGFQALGQALAGSKDGFKKLGAAVRNIFGDMLIQIGEGIIGLGKAVEFMKKTLTTFFGGFAIAGGLALIALGGALKGSAGGLGSAATGDALVDRGNDVLDLPYPEDQEERKTIANINVQGEIFSPNDVGLRIAEVLNEAGFASGVQTT